jgi:hypothetical protein
MALKININQLHAPQLFKQVLGIGDVTEVYIKITRYSGEENTCRFIASFFNNTMDDFKNRRNLNFPETVYSFEVNESGDENDFNVRKQGYEYLKTLPEFAGCEDC